MPPRKKSLIYTIKISSKGVVSIIEATTSAKKERNRIKALMADSQPLQIAILDASRDDLPKSLWVYLTDP